MADVSNHSAAADSGGDRDAAAAGHRPRQQHRSDGSVEADLRWARRQRLLALIGAAISVLALVLACLGLSRLPVASAADARGYGIVAVVGSGVLALSCLVIAACWLIQLPQWRSLASGGADGDAGYRNRVRVSLVAHLASYAAVLVTMYGALAGSALAYWDSVPAALLGAVFILVIFGQILAGTQLLRRSGPPATIPNYLRKLNDKVQSLR